MSESGQKNLAVFCRERLEGATGGDRKFAAEVLTIFMKSFAKDLSEIESAAARGDERSLRYYARLAGASSQTVGADRLAGICLRLEKQTPIAKAADVALTLAAEIGFFADQVVSFLLSPAAA